jgi:8-oxo-dGTP diphosphatase
MWEFPGGKIESAESPESALHRELKEELDLDPFCLSQLVALPSVTHAYDFAVIRLLPFLVRCAKRPSMRLLEHSELRWIGFEEVEKLAWAPADVPILEELSKCLLRE